MAGKKFSLVLLFICGITASQAQICNGNGRYLQRVFPQIIHTADIQFATVQALPTVYVNETQTVTQNLYLDVFEPAGDTLQKRPLVILAFGGAFLIGTKNDADIQAACDSLAHLGYVTASIQYRLGLNPTNAESGERAVYRAAQDYSAAVRYFKQYASLYKIDSSAIFVGGASAGSFAAMHMAYGQEDERPASTYAQAGLFPMPDLGCFDCSGNNYNYSHKVRGILNMWGAIGYLDWIEANDPPIVSFHGNMDPLVPYSEGYPFTVGATLPYVYGSAKITERMQQLGIYNEFYTYESAIHQLWGGALESTWAFGPTEFQQPILNGIRLFLYKQLKPTPSPEINGIDEICSGSTVWYSVNFRPGFRYCWQVQNGQVLQQNNNQLQVKWTSAGSGQVSVQEFNQLDIPTDSALVKNILIKQTPTVTAQVSDNSICVGDTIILTGNGAEIYNWTPATTLSNPDDSITHAWPAQNTTYSLTGISNQNCIGSAQVSVIVNLLPISPFITRMDTLLYIPEQYQSYQWFLNGNMLTGETQNTTLISSDGIYTCQVGQGTGCYIFSHPYTVSNLSITNQPINLLHVFPNPFEGSIQMDIPSGPYVGNIKDMHGITVHQFYFEAGNGNYTLTAEGLPAGMYILQLQNGNGQTFYAKLVRQ